MVKDGVFVGDYTPKQGRLSCEITGVKMLSEMEGEMLKKPEGGGGEKGAEVGH